jgi:hypothetical protein
MVQKRVRRKKTKNCGAEDRRHQYGQAIVVINKRRLGGEIFIITIESVLADPGTIFFFMLNMMVMREHIM